MNRTLNENRIRKFFSEYEKRFNNALKGEIDVSGIVEAFAGYFVSANPSGIYGGKNDDAFKQTITKGYTFYKTIGTKSMRVRSVDITTLDGLHFMAKVFWHSEYEKKDGNVEAIDFDVIYLLQLSGERLKIFAYVTGDEQSALRAHGIIS